MAPRYRNGLVVLAIALTSVFRQPARGVAQEQRPPTPVTIVDSVPLPISGTVTIGGESTVTVANPPTAPVQVQDVDRAAREPFQFGSIVASYTGTSASRTIVTVPGRQATRPRVCLRVDQRDRPGWAAGRESPFVRRCGQRTAVQLDREAPLNFIHACTGQIRQYVTAGQTLQFGFSAFSSAGGFYRIFVAGYYEAVP